MYSVSSLKYGLRNPRSILQECNRLYHRRLGTWSHNRRGIDIVDADWDNMLILDACRYDMFEELHDLPGELKPVYSRGSATKEFLQANFDGRDMRDTVYVTASPMLYRHHDGIDVQFHDVVNVWQESGWNEQYRTVLPDTVTEAALEAAEEYPHKRLLVHYLQPHYPFVGSTGREHFDLDRLDFEWDEIRTGELGISDEVVWRAFKENLEIVLPHADTLLRELSGKTVVTADHGQLIGERLFPLPFREYGHPAGIYSEELVKVPWLTYENGPRREITAGDVRESGGEAELAELANERLQHLGYVD